MNNFLAILEFCAFCMEYKNAKFTGINFCGQTSVEYSMQIQHLRFYKDTAKVFLSLLKITTKSTHFLPAKKAISILWIEHQTNKLQKLSKPYI